MNDFAPYSYLLHSYTAQVRDSHVYNLQTTQDSASQYFQVNKSAGSIPRKLPRTLSCLCFFIAIASPDLNHVFRGYITLSDNNTILCTRSTSCIGQYDISPHSATTLHACSLSLACGPFPGLRIIWAGAPWHLLVISRKDLGNNVACCLKSRAYVAQTNTTIHLDHTSRILPTSCPVLNTTGDRWHSAQTMAFTTRLLPREQYSACAFHARELDPSAIPWMVRNSFFVNVVCR